MCFSAEASFVASAGLAVGGIATLRHVDRSSAGTARSERALAAVPLLFAVHQATEGMVWLNIDRDAEALWTHVFAVLAYCAWPIYMPLALYFHESEPARKKRLLALIGIGCAVAAYFLYYMIDDSLKLRVTHHNLRYRFDYPLVEPAHIAYGVAVMLGPALSRSGWLKIFGATLFVAYGLAYTIWDETHPSVWCYFAALLSLIVYLHFRFRGGINFRQNFGRTAANLQ